MKTHSSSHICLAEATLKKSLFWSSHSLRGLSELTGVGIVHPDEVDKVDQDMVRSENRGLCIGSDQKGVRWSLFPGVIFVMVMLL